MEPMEIVQVIISIASLIVSVLTLNQVNQIKINNNQNADGQDIYQNISN